MLWRTVPGCPACHKHFPHSGRSHQLTEVMEVLWHSLATWTVILAWRRCMLNRLRFVLDLMLMPGSVSWKASVSTAWNIMLNSVRASTHPCFTAFVTGKVDLHHQVHKRACSCGIGILYKSVFQGNQTYSWSSKAAHDLRYWMSWSSPWMQCKGQHFFFLALLLRLSGSKYHVYCSSFFPEATLALGE